jgi:hypothetical protein
MRSDANLRKFFARSLGRPEIDGYRPNVANDQGFGVPGVVTSGWPRFCAKSHVQSASVE